VKHTVDKTRAFNYRALDTCAVFEGDPRTRTLRSANGDGLNVALAHGAVYWRACRSSVIVLKWASHTFLSIRWYWVTWWERDIISSSTLIREVGPFGAGYIFRQHAEIVTQVAKECKCSMPTHNGTVGGDPNGLQPADGLPQCTTHKCHMHVTRFPRYDDASWPSGIA